MKNLMLFSVLAVMGTMLFSEEAEAHGRRRRCCCRPAHDHCRPAHDHCRPAHDHCRPVYDNCRPTVTYYYDSAPVNTCCQAAWTAPTACCQPAWTTRTACCAPAPVPVCTAACTPVYISRSTPTCCVPSCAMIEVQANDASTSNRSGRQMIQAVALR